LAAVFSDHGPSLFYAGSSFTTQLFQLTFDANPNTIFIGDVFPTGSPPSHLLETQCQQLKTWRFSSGQSNVNNLSLPSQLAFAGDRLASAKSAALLVMTLIHGCGQAP
jgi:hypothetical protein